MSFFWVNLVENIESAVEDKKIEKSFMIFSSYRIQLKCIYTLLLGSAMATYDSIGVNAPVTFKWTEVETPATPKPTEAWERHVNSAGITNWEDHLRSQGIDPQVCSSQSFYL